MNDEDEVMEFLRHLENEGILEWVGMDGQERTFIFRFDIMQVKMPELYLHLVQELDDELMNLYRLGLIDLEYDENLNAGFRINENGRKYLEDCGIPIPEEWEK